MNSTKQKRQKTGRRLKFTNDDLWGYIFIAAAMIIFCVFTLYPVFSAIYTSFFNYKPFGSEFVGLKNYVDTLKYSKFNLFYKAAGNTLIYTVIVVPLSLLLSFAMGLLLCKRTTQYVRKNTKGMMKPLLCNIARCFVMHIVPLLVIASVVETYVTPWVMNLFI